MWFLRLTRFERTRLISARAMQIALGAPPLVKVSPDDSPYDIAKKEFEEKVLPLSVIRVFPNGKRVFLEVGENGQSSTKID